MNGITCQFECECTQRNRAARRAPRYYVEVEKIYRADVGEYKTYAIAFYCAGRNKILHDVSLDPDVAVNIVDALNRNNVSPVHLVDIVRDLLP